MGQNIEIGHKRMEKFKMVSGVIGDLYAKYLSDRSFFGYKTSVLKSGFQKYGRRAEVEKGLWCLVEMDLFSMLEWKGDALNAYMKKYPAESRTKVQRSAKTVRSNMVNRLVAMVSEEVSISSWWMPIKILELYEKWHANRDNPLSRKILIDMYLYLTSQKMIRLISDLKSVYLLPPYYVKPKQMNDMVQIHNNIKKLYPKIYSDQSKVGRINWGVNFSNYPIKIQNCTTGIYYNLELGSDNVFYWISKMYFYEAEDGVRKNTYLKLIWLVLHSFIQIKKEYGFLSETISALQYFHKKLNHKEYHNYIHHAVLLLVRRTQINCGSTDPRIDTPFADIMKLYDDHLAGGKMPMDDYILDLHTHVGKQSANCLENFALEGAYIENEDLNFLRQDYREIYVRLKQELDRYRCNGGRLK